MIIQEIINQTRSGVCKIEFYLNGVLVNSGSGFIYKGRLVTNSHVFHPSGFVFDNETKLNLIFGDKEKTELEMKDLKLITGSDESNADFAVYDVSEKVRDIEKRFNFDLSNLEYISEGDEVVLLGFPFGTSYLTTHYGRISALYEDGGINKIQIDASINQGNSGGPLYHLATEKVIGIVTRKQSGLAKDFDDLLESFSENIRALEAAQKNGSIGMLGINPIEFFKVSQNQMKLISQNIKRSANTGIGYAFSCEKLLEEDF
ncbi:MAG: serine protease [Patescibacteria group bacterium]